MSADSARCSLLTIQPCPKHFLKLKQSSLALSAFLILCLQKSLIILGDVGPGAKVISGGNIIVLGALRGHAYAGIDNDDNCFIAAGTIVNKDITNNSFVISKKELIIKENKNRLID